MSDPLDAKLFTHPACACGPTIELVKNVLKDKENFNYKEISLKTPDGRKQAAEAGVKIIPSLYFIKSNKLLVTSEEITEINIEKEILKLTDSN
ncbi:MAG: hypothetical protein GPJ54_05410 [Candidatus Heimdallarchaeota archaeon]|nr:hypothetical protein [Candidatus Heimdallarchaeota archaeon]